LQIPLENIPERVDHTISITKDDSGNDVLVIIGGMDLKGPHNDVWICDMKTVEQYLKLEQ
jgi:hypothetical protein